MIRTTLSPAFSLFHPGDGWLSRVTYQPGEGVRVVWGSAVGCRLFRKRSRADRLCEVLADPAITVMVVLVEVPLL